MRLCVCLCACVRERLTVDKEVFQLCYCLLSYVRQEMRKEEPTREIPKFNLPFLPHRTHAINDVHFQKTQFVKSMVF